ncbi:MAG TPA: sensor histidine kinase [Nocardioidaceae bacterium]|nr:sensor histidine kinase [Nocardioidaceae bacterium]
MKVLPRWRRLSTQILVTQLAVLLVCGGFAFGLSAYFIRHRLDESFEQRALSVATSLAGLPVVRHDLRSGDPHRDLQTLAERVRRRTHVTYVVIADRHGIRYSHPDPWKIGKHVSTPFHQVLAGHDWVGIQTGTLGRSARGKSPVFGADGQVIGEVSVGTLESRVSQQLAGLLPTLGLYLGLAMLIGAAASLALAARMKRRTFGLELDEIADLLQEREAMLHGVREGVVALDKSGRVRLMNDEARDLLDLHGDVVGSSVEELVPPGRLREVITGAVATEDATVVSGQRMLVLNRMPVRLRDRQVGAGSRSELASPADARREKQYGAVVTMRDRTEPEELLRQLDAAASLTSTLRAQTHEFTNRMHTLLGLLELERYEEASEFLTRVSGAHAALTERVSDQVRDPVLAALVIAKVSAASERGVVLQLDPRASVPGRVTGPVDAVTVVGNLIDNAIDAATRAGQPAETCGEPWVSVDLRSRGSTLAVTVTDSGPGVRDEHREAIFTDGYSTKSQAAGARRGVGLALIAQTVSRRGGTIQVGGPGGHFHVSLPGVIDSEPVQVEVLR